MVCCNSMDSGLRNRYIAWFFPTFWPWNGFSVLLVSYFRIVTAIESRAAPRSLSLSDFLLYLLFSTTAIVKVSLRLEKLHKVCDLKALNGVKAGPCQ